MTATPTNESQPLTPAEIQEHLEAALANKDRPNGITDDQIRQLFAIIGRPRPAPEFFQSWDEGVAEYRRQVQEELERELAEEGNK